MNLLKNFRCLLPAVLAVGVLLASCYRIVLIEQAHEVVRGGSFAAKMVVKRSGSNTNGSITQCHGLFGIRVPEGWSVGADIVMTQVVRPTTQLEDEAYAHDITRRLIPNTRYTRLLNRDYPRQGYTWLGFATEQDFKTLFNSADESQEVDSIYLTFTVQTTADRTGTYYLDYIAGHIAPDKLARVDSEERDWVTRVATFTGDNISNLLLADTRIRVTNADGSVEEGAPEDVQWDVPAEWQLDAMPLATEAGTARAYKDLKYNKLFTRTRGWNGGDGVLTVGLPNGDVFWTFNDSFYGTVNPRNRARQSCNFPRNSVMVQRAHDGVLGETDADLVWLADYVNWKNSTQDRYFQCRTHLRHPLGEKTDAEIAAGDIDQSKVYWSGDGTVYNGKLQMIWIGVESAELRNLGTALATYSLDGRVPENYYSRTIPDYLPAEGDYLYRESVTHDINQNEVSYGSTLWEDEDGHTYLYACANNSSVVARTQTHDLYSPWQYYVCTASGQWRWQDDYPDEETRKRSSIMTSSSYGIMLPWVFKEDGWYFMVSQAPVFSREVYIYRSRKPYGPFGERRLLCQLPDHLDKLGPQQYHWLYMVNLHPALSRQGELVLSTNSDPADFWDNFNAEGSADFYRPFFYRVFDWQRLYDDLPNAIPAVRDASASIPVSADGRTYYNMVGQRVQNCHLHKGIYIKGHKKIVKR